MCLLYTYTNMLLVRKNQNVLGFRIRKHEKKITSKAVTEVKNDSLPYHRVRTWDHFFFF